MMTSIDGHQSYPWELLSSNYFSSNI
uniref:Uncharacterized protein n=1 Tax=Rhizophora mucronata TaxID=61149 RepID=A0A2P2NKT3_RHIMU